MVELLTLNINFPNHTDIHIFFGTVVKWFANGQMIKQSKYFDMKTTQDVHTLTIAEVFPEDEGYYMVTGQNTAGEVSSTARLDVCIVIGYS